MTIDLTKLDKPFGELDDATKGALLLSHHHGEAIDFYDDTMNLWKILKNPYWGKNSKYRVRPAPVVVGSVTMSGCLGDCYDLNSGGDHSDKDPTSITVTFPTKNGRHVPGVYTSLMTGLQIVIEVLK